MGSETTDKDRQIALLLEAFLSERRENEKLRAALEEILKIVSDDDGFDERWDNE